MLRIDLGPYADPTQFHENLDIAGWEAAHLLGFLESMLRIRAAERRLALGRKDGTIGGPVHLGVGQEAIAVGVSHSLRQTDRIFGAHRSHSHLLALGSSLRKLFAEVLGRDTGHSRGMGGSMHLWDQSHGFYGSVPIVSGTVSLAVGAGLAARMQACGDLAVAYLGDGAVEEGVVHEALNLARVQEIPVLFVVENNLFASHMHISLRQPANATARFAAANLMPYEIVDGNDVLVVAKAARRMVDISRAGGGPGFLEAVTHRWFGHVDWREDIDVGVNRSRQELDTWRDRDPVLRLQGAMIAAGILDDSGVQRLVARVDRETEEAWASASGDPYPQEASLLDRVYAS